MSVVPDVEHAGDVRVIHQRQGLAFGLEPGDDRLGIHARFDDLEGDRSADGLLLLGHVDDAHAPFADLLEQLVWADPFARAIGNGNQACALGGFSLRRLFRRCGAPKKGNKSIRFGFAAVVAGDAGSRRTGGADERPVQENIRLVTRLQERLNPSTQLNFRSAFAFKNGGAIDGSLKTNRRQECGLYAFGVNRHGSLQSYPLTIHASSAVQVVEEFQTFVVVSGTGPVSCAF